MNVGWLDFGVGNRYFLRKLKKVKKSNGQILAINEVLFSIVFYKFGYKHFCFLFCLVLFYEYLSYGFLGGKLVCLDITNLLKELM